MPEARGSRPKPLAHRDPDKLEFYKEGIEEIMNLQPVSSNAKPYQVKQVRNVILKYKLGDDIDV